jgi:succinate dehydrogenase / fumarate reductase membrane anchor subunit
MASLRSPLGRARGLGSAKDGTHHWWAQRVTAIALVPLVVWFAVGVLRLAGAPHAAVTQWIAHPVNAVLLAALVVAVFHHAQLGLQVVIEDYVHGEALRIAALLAVKAASWLLAVASLFAIVRIFVS